MIWVLFAGLAALTVIIMLDPLRRSEAVAADRIASAVTVHVDQLREIDKDAERGLISTEEAKAAKVEIERRLIALERTKSTTGHFETGGRGALWLSALMVLNRPGFTGGQNFRRIAHYGTVTQQEDLEAVFT
ncbi:c-type cytochrome biogenesis protein CcmI [Sulfitobacter sp. M220]|jgi:cytochrome c-type biogenesis protein CcmH|uniref:c-type cytochrome biogenesis protein CcmI n=1 Tax=Sulfitobacter sp. M220 TaxID=2675333 RepID=UPI001F02299D|nr:c-type cytochrome biogenesis protein CcmI [Sulfitobacter sp. M220]MCF7779582.1 c-type cytochrome biogenesis protein CcmI [Sulfitobacter sp. M220]